MKWRYLILIFCITGVAKGYSSQISYEERMQTKVDMKNKRILISGAGVAGLTLAYWLKQYGFVPTLIEKHPILRTGGYKIDIRGVAIDVVKRMGAYPQIVDQRTDIQGATIMDPSGVPVTTMSADLCGGRVEGDLEIMRGDLCEILLKQVGDVECLFGDVITQMEECEEGVYVEFDKSDARVFDLVIGADGLHSNVRKLVFGEESHFLQELGLYVSVYSIPNFLNLDRWEIEYFEPQKFVNVYSSRQDVDAIAGFAFASKSLYFDPRDISEQKRLLKEAFANVGWEVPRLLAEMDAASDFYFDSIAQIHMSQWRKGRVALVGDAGYACSPVSGQGTSVAIIGAYVLAGELAQAQGDYNAAFSEYERNLRKFVKKNQELVKMSVSYMTEKDSFLAWLYLHLMKFLPANWVHFLKNRGTKQIQEAANDLVLKNYASTN
jgi:2-polyprenyl-6-methoxyphenol hydroxylase-like FAD-dependent oxidoreductase